MNNQRNNIRTDKFGNPFQLIRLKAPKNAPDSNGLFKGFIEINGSLYSITITHCSSQSKDGRNCMWGNVTKLPKRQNNNKF